MARKGSSRSIRNLGRSIKATGKAIGKVKAQATKASKKRAEQAELSKIERLLGEDFDTLAQARRALKRESKPVKPIGKKQAPKSGGRKQTPPRPPQAPPPAPRPPRQTPKEKQAANQPTITIEQVPGRVSKNVRRAMLQMMDDDLGQRMDKLLGPNCKWGFTITGGPGGAFKYKSTRIFDSWQEMIEYLSGYRSVRKGEDEFLGQVTFVKICGGKPVEEMTEEEEERFVGGYEAKLRRTQREQAAAKLKIKEAQAQEIEKTTGKKPRNLRTDVLLEGMTEVAKTAQARIAELEALVSKLQAEGSKKPAKKRKGKK